MNASDEKLVHRVLNKVNAVREAIGEEPLDDLKPGRPSDWDRCPVARSLPRGFNHVSGGTMQCPSPAKRDLLIEKLGLKPTFGFRHVEFNGDVKEFVRKFDAGTLPEYRQRRKR